MRQTLSNVFSVLAVLAIGIVIGALIRSRKDGGPETIVITKTDTLVRVDTLHHPYPVPVEVRVVDSILVPVPVPGDTDTLYVPVPREQKVYQDPDSTYRAVVSGYLPSLDTIDV